MKANHKNRRRTLAFTNSAKMVRTWGKKFKLNLTSIPDFLKKILAPIARFFSPNFSCCHRCEMPWSVVNGHHTKYTDTKGCFPLCKSCWSKLTPKERLPYYEDLIESRDKAGYGHGEDEKNKIRKAVIEGK